MGSRRARSTTTAARPWPLAWLTVAALVATLAPARATPTPAPGAPGSRTIVLASSARWRWEVRMAPHLAAQIGALAVTGLAVIAGRATTPTAVYGEGRAPAGWPWTIDDTLRSIPPASKTERVAVAFGVASFTLAASDQGLAMLELRMRYQDGAVAWLNGVEVMRRSIPRAADAMRPAIRPHGPEWETIYIPVAPHLLNLGRNVLALEVRPSARRTAPSTTVELIGRRDRGIVRGPTLTGVGATAATIAVVTDPQTTAVLEWGTGAALDRREERAPGRDHVFSLAGLPPRSRIRYRVRAGAQVSETYSFSTTPGTGDVIRIGVYGDVRGGHAVHQRLIEAMLAEPLDLVTVTGDLVLRGSDHADWQRFFAITQPLLAQVPYLPAIGNHDLGWRHAVGADPTFALPAGPPDRPGDAYWYSHDVADVHLVFLDSNAYDRIEQVRWLDADLAAARARGVRAIVAMTHDGPYSRGYHRGNVDARTRYVPILARHRVDLLLAGHDHLYQRGEIDGVRYVVTGGGGASLYAISCGVRGKRKCKVEDGMQAIAREHHYLVVTVGHDTLELCPRRADGRLLERCTRAPLRRSR